MKRTRTLGLAGACATAVVLIGTAGAVAKPVGVHKIDLSSRTAVAKYLHSVGVSSKGVVIQRGRHNYAGPNCPGRGWTCTTSRRVVQVAGNGGENQFECTPSEGGTASSPDTCVIVQGPAKHNKAKCVERIRTDLPDVHEHCTITQTGDDNNAEIDMLIVQTGSPDQNATQDVQVNQNTDAAKNDVHSKTRVVQKTDTKNDAASGAFKAAADPNDVNQTQDTSQDVRVQQFASGPGDNDSHVDNSYRQDARANGGVNVTQMQNASGTPDANVDVRQNSDGGKNHSDLDISSDNVAVANNAAGTVEQTQGSPSGGLDGSSNQSSVGGDAPILHTRPGNHKPGNLLDATIHEDMLALSNVPGAIQRQHGPTICCSSQVGNPDKDRQNIRELINLRASSLPMAIGPMSGPQQDVEGSVQTDLNELHCDTDGVNGCDGKIKANVNGAVGMATCQTTPCDIFVACSSAGDTGACVPVQCEPAPTPTTPGSNRAQQEGLPTCANTSPPPPPPPPIT